MSKKILFATAALLGSLTMPVMAADPAPAATAAAAPATSSDPVVARVNGEAIHRSDVMRELQMGGDQLRQMPPQMLYPKILEMMIATKIVSDKGYAANMQTDADVKERVKELQDKIVAEAYIHKQVEPKITDAKIKERYDQLAAKFKPQDEVRARHILISTQVKPGATAEEKAEADTKAKAEAEDIIKQLKAGADFAKLAGEKSKDTGSAQQGGDLGYFAHDAMLKPFADAAFSMKPGEISETPVKTDYGYHIIKVEDKRKSSFPPVAQLKDQISSQLGQELANDEVKEMIAKAKVEKFNIDGTPMVADADKKK
jgi:peptidyl-prolyl cis-trans isomerase C